MINRLGIFPWGKMAIVACLLLSSCSSAQNIDTDLSAKTPVSEAPAPAADEPPADTAAAPQSPEATMPAKSEAAIAPPASQDVKMATTQSPTVANASSTGSPPPPRLLTAAELGWAERLLPVPGRDIIIDQSFWLTLRDLGEVAFVATQAVSDPTQGANNLGLDVITANGDIYTLPANEDANAWMLWDVKAVTFEELDFDGSEPDVIVIADYITGAGPAGSDPFPVTTVYFNQGTYFTTDQSLNRLLTDRGVKTISEALDILRNELMYLP